MDVSLLSVAIEAMGTILEPTRMLFLAGGVLLGLALGVIPGLGGIVGMALLLPFTFDIDPYSAFALLLGMGSVTTTSDTIPAVLFGVPGTAGSAATILDGHPLARQGQAGRAFGAAYTASMMGGILGAMLLAVSIPIPCNAHCWRSRVTLLRVFWALYGFGSFRIVTTSRANCGWIWLND